MAINNGYLLGLYGGSYDPSASAALTNAITKKAQPTAPWATALQASAPKPDALVRAALDHAHGPATRARHRKAREPVAEAPSAHHALEQ